MPRKKKQEEIRPDFKQDFKQEFKQDEITPLENNGGLVVTREEFNQVVDKVNELIKKVN